MLLKKLWAHADYYTICTMGHLMRKVSIVLKPTTIFYNRETMGNDSPYNELHPENTSVPLVCY